MLDVVEWIIFTTGGVFGAAVIILTACCLYNKKCCNKTEDCSGRENARRNQVEPPLRQANLPPQD